MGKFKFVEAILAIASAVVATAKAILKFVGHCKKKNDREDFGFAV